MRYCMTFSSLGLPRQRIGWVIGHARHTQFEPDHGRGRQCYLQMSCVYRDHHSLSSHSGHGVTLL